MTGDPLTWQQWWDNIAMSGFAGSALTGLIAGGAVWIGFRNERRLSADQELRRALASVSQTGLSYSVALRTADLTTYEGRKKLWTEQVLPFYRTIVSASALTGKKNARLRENLDWVASELSEEWRGDPRDEFQYFDVLDSSLQVATEIWLKLGPRKYQKHGSRISEYEEVVAARKLREPQEKVEPPSVE